METKSKVEGLQISSPPPPEISGSIVVGLNNITRSLESLSKSSKPPNAPYPPDGERESLVDDARHFSAVFVLRSSQPPILHSHLPQLIATASLAHPNLPATRLVQLSNGCDARLCEALGLPRVSFIGILEGAPHSKSLVDLVQKCVPEIQIPWIQEVTASKYLPVKINAIQTFAPVTKSESQAT
jgi:ribonuclease P/MRP protein subunit POP3